MADGGVLAADPGNDSVFWSGGKWYYMSVCVTTDEGWSWNRYDPSPYEGWTYAIAVDPANSNTIYAGGIPYVYRTTDFGQTWTACSTGMTGYAYDLAVHVLDPDFLVAGTCDGIYISSNAGETWTNHGCANVNALLVSTSSLDTIIAGTDTGVFQSADQGSNWTAMGLDNQYVRHLHEYPEVYYYAGTYGSGVFRWPINVGSEEHTTTTPARLAVSVFPNPFTRNTSFTYMLPAPALVRIALYDALGRHIRTLIAQHQGAGQHIFDWNGKDARGVECAPGVYFYTLRAGPVVRSGSVIRFE